MRELRAQLRDLLRADAEAESVLELDREAARQVQLAFYAEQIARKPVSSVLAEAGAQAFQYLEATRPPGAAA